MKRILILGGTTEARQLAARLAARGDLDIILSMAGRTENPVEQPVPVRTGGFGGAQGLADWLLECGEEITAPDRQATARVVVAQLSVSLNLARLYPPTFAPMDPDAVVPILRRNALAALAS